MNNLHSLGQYMHQHTLPNLDKIRQLLLLVNTHVGEYKWSCRTTDFNGWLVCDGRSLSIEDYPQLFSAIGTAYGGGEGTFNLPDFKGRVMGAVGQGAGLSNRVMGDSVGTETQALTVDQLPNHNHGGFTGSNGLHSHTTNATGGQGSLGLCTADGTNTVDSVDTSLGELNVWTTPRALTIDNNGEHSHTIAAAGSNLPHNNMQPTLFAGNVVIFSGKITADVSGVE